MRTLILGGVRSGKSRYAETLAKATTQEVVYIATATASDEEMSRRIERHRTHRPKDWAVIEEPRFLAKVLESVGDGERTVIVDCLTLWMTNVMFDDDPNLFDRQRAALLGVLGDFPGRLILVSNEINMGVHPMSESARRFCDEAGLLHQAVAALCDNAVLMVVGLPQVLKSSEPLPGVPFRDTPEA